VTIWVGVPDDPYIDDKRQLTTVDIQLREGASVIASLSTVLEPDQTSEALALAREVKAAIESGEIEHGLRRIGAEAHSSGLMRRPADRDVLPKVERPVE